MTVATDPKRQRRALTEAEYRRFDAVMASALDNLDALRDRRRFWVDWIDAQAARNDTFQRRIWLSDREREIVEEIAVALGEIGADA